MDGRPVRILRGGPVWFCVSLALGGSLYPHLRQCLSPILFYTLTLRNSKIKRSQHWAGRIGGKDSFQLLLSLGRGETSQSTNIY